ncbi:MAG: alpha/beta hydrolase [Thermoguttaceae bacterium]
MHHFSFERNLVRATLMTSAAVAVGLAWFGVAAAASPSEPSKVSLWTGPAPVGDGRVERSDTTITVYRAPSKTDAPAVVICPGGGYVGWMIEPEGHEIARWLTRHGIAGVVLPYRLPKGRPRVPLLDAQRTVRVIRFNAKSWGIDPKRVGIMGFSAGGHVAATAATHFDAGDPKAADSIDHLSCRPDFAILIYPVITMGEKTHAGSKEQLLGAHPSPKMVTLFSNETQVTDATPPMFLAHAKNDSTVAPENSRMMYQALRTHQVSAEYLELPSGGHGLDGYRGPMWEAWRARLLDWLAAEKIVRP